MSANPQISPESEVQQLLEAAERECRHDHSESGFRDALLRHLQRESSAVAVRLWDLRAQQEPACVATCGISVPPPATADLTATALGVVDHVRRCVATSDGEADRLLTASAVAGGISLALEIVTVSPESVRHFMEPVCDVLADLQRRLLLGRLAGREEQLLRALELISLLHADLRQDRVANTLANDAAAVFGCERVSVCRRTTSGGWVVAAATSVPEPERRADAVRQIARLVEQEASRAAGPDSAACARPDGAPPPTSDDRSAEEPLIVPLNLEQDWQLTRWAAVFEMPDASSADPHILQWVCRHASVALRNAERLADASLTSRIMRLPQTALSSRPLMVVGILIVVAVVFLTGSTDFRIEAFGQVVPDQRVHIFTPDSGIISSVNVAEGDTVAPGQVLFLIRNDEVELQLETVNGDLAAAEARLAALQTMRGSFGADRSGKLSGEEAELTARIRSLKQQSRILQRREEDLTVCSEIAGTVYGDFVREHLQDRPVQRAQHLFDIADPQAEWQLELNVPEAEIRHVLAASRAADQPLPISYTLETNPEVTLTTQVHEINSAIAMDSQGDLSTRITAKVEKAPSVADRMGAGVIAHVHCGRRSRGYVYFRRVIEFVQRQWF